MALAQHCPHLQELELSYCTDVTEHDLLVMVSSLTSLKELILTRYSVVTDAVLAGIAQKLQALRVLGLRETSGYTITGAIAMISALKRVQRLSVSGSDSVFSPTVLDLLQHARPRLTVEKDGAYHSTTYFETHKHD